MTTTALLQIHVFAKACQRRKLKHLRTKPYTPRTNGKAERFIRHPYGWAYARLSSSRQRIRAAH